MSSSQSNSHEEPPLPENLRNSNLSFRIGSICLGAIVQVVVGVGLGYWLDQVMGTFFLTLVGLALGMILATVSLIRFAQKWTPKAKRSAKELKDWNPNPASPSDDNLDGQD